MATTTAAIKPTSQQSVARSPTARIMGGGGSTVRTPTPDESSGFRMLAFGEYVEDQTASALKQRDHKDATDLIATRQGGSFDDPKCFAQNTRDEVRMVGGDGQVAGALAAEPGMKQQNYIAFSSKDHGSDAPDVSPTLRSMNHSQSHANGGGQVAVALPVRQECDTFNAKGINHASAQKTNTGTLLRELSEAVGAEAFTQWGLGILDSLQPAEVLRSALYGCGVRFTANFSRSWLVHHALARPEAHTEGIVQAMREAERDGRASQGWRPPEQLARELGAYLSELSQPGPQAARFVRDLWQASEGVELLRQALSALQEVGRSTNGEGEPTRLGMQVRRLTPEECEFLQGFPRGYTLVPHRGKPAKDGPRYKALGNSMAVNVMRWIGERIAIADRL